MVTPAVANAWNVPLVTVIVVVTLGLPIAAATSALLLALENISVESSNAVWSGTPSIGTLGRGAAAAKTETVFVEVTG